MLSLDKVFDEIVRTTRCEPESQLRLRGFSQNIKGIWCINGNFWTLRLPLSGAHFYCIPLKKTLLSSGMKRRQRFEFIEESEACSLVFLELAQVNALRFCSS